MADISKIKEHMPVMSSDGEHIGTVDHIEGHRIKLTKSDPASGGAHHFIHTDMVLSVAADGVRLTRTAVQTRDEWGSE